MPSRKEIEKKYHGVDMFTTQNQHRGVPGAI